MEALKEKIAKEGQAIGGDIVKVDGFLNHRIDVAFLEQIGQAFGSAFRDAGANKILTIEASGIAIACAAARYLGDLPVVYAKKAAPNTMVDGFYETEVTSFTKRTVSKVIISRSYLGPEDRALIIDDFLAHGESALGLMDLVEQAGGRVVGAGAVIEKEFQGGGARIREKGVPLVSLAVITSIQDGKIYYRED
ncbi:MAG: xanthine phosphoribosyltransferase [Bacillota bacterium]|nr:xanthine phosphoribosyltransferase [Bacillota bacterium]